MTTQDFNAVRGDKFNVMVEFFNDDDTALDLSGYASAKMMLKEAPLGEAILSFSTEDNTISLSGNKVTLSQTSNSMNIPEGRYVYDLEFTDSLGERTTLIGGGFTVKADVTR